MNTNLKIANYLLAFHVIMNFLIVLLSIPTVLLYFIDMVADTDDIEADNIILTIYLLLLGILQFV